MQPREFYLTTRIFAFLQNYFSKLCSGVRAFNIYKIEKIRILPTLLRRPSRGPRLLPVAPCPAESQVQLRQPVSLLMRLYAHYQHISHVGGRLSGTLPRGLGCQWDVTLAMYSTGHQSGLLVDKDSDWRAYFCVAARGREADFENISTVSAEGNDGGEEEGGGGEVSSGDVTRPGEACFSLPLRHGESCGYGGAASCSQ